MNKNKYVITLKHLYTETIVTTTVTMEDSDLDPESFGDMYLSNLRRGDFVKTKSKDGSTYLIPVDRIVSCQIKLCHY